MNDHPKGNDKPGPSESVEDGGENPMASALEEKGSDVAPGQPAEKVEDRENVSQVTPEDYPKEERQALRP